MAIISSGLGPLGLSQVKLFRRKYTQCPPMFCGDAGPEAIAT